MDQGGPVVNIKSTSGRYEGQKRSLVWEKAFDQPKKNLYKICKEHLFSLCVTLTGSQSVWLIDIHQMLNTVAEII